MSLPAQAACGAFKNQEFKQRQSSWIGTPHHNRDRQWTIQCGPVATAQVWLWILGLTAFGIRDLSLLRVHCRHQNFRIDRLGEMH